MSDCLFCKIIAGELPSYRIYEDDQVLAFLDINPVSRGHLLVIPKEHSDSIGGLSAELLSPVFGAAQRLGAAAEQAFDAPGFNLVVNKGAAAGQLVGHTHVHVIPRQEGDGLKHWPKIDITEEEFPQVAQELTTALK